VVDEKIYSISTPAIKAITGMLNCMVKVVFSNLFNSGSEPPAIITAITVKSLRAE
jgi:hypothetical protein